MYQLVPSLDLSKTYTLGVCDSSNNITVVSGVFSKGAETENETTKIEMAILDGYAEVIIGNAGKDKTYIWAALYEGAYTTDTLPPYVPRPYAVELAECQRYYRAFRDVNIPCSNNPEGTYITGFLPVDMRTTPTVSTGASNHLFYGGGNFAQITAISCEKVGTGLKFGIAFGQSIPANQMAIALITELTLSCDL